MSGSLFPPHHFGAVYLIDCLLLSLRGELICSPRSQVAQETVLRDGELETIFRAGASKYCMRLMTFNIRFLNSVDGPNDWEYRKELVLEVFWAYLPIWWLVRK